MADAARPGPRVRLGTLRAGLLAVLWLWPRTGSGTPPAHSGSSARHRPVHAATASPPAPNSAPNPASRAGPGSAAATATARSQAARSEASHAGALRDAARLQAQAAAERALALSRQTVQAAAQVQRTEQAAGDAVDRADALEQQRAAAAAALAADSRALAPLLPVIERLSLYPSETLLAAPFDPADALTGLSVLRQMGRTLERRAEETRDAADRLQALEASLQTAKTRLAALRRDQAAQQAALQTRADAARAVQAESAQQFDQAARNAAAAAARAATLDGMVARIEAAERMARLQAERDARLAAARPATNRQAAIRPDIADTSRASLQAGRGLAAGGGQAGAPVAGRLVQRFGDATDAGTASGVRYAPPSQATVTAPCGGRIAFAGPFRSYGQMLILDCGGQDRFVLAGLGAIDVGIGQGVARGAQLGHMPNWSDGRDRPGLYVQLRHGDRTIDPLRFLPH